MDVTSSFPKLQIDPPVIKSAFTPSPFIIMRHGGLAEPLDCSTPALDLCVRPKRRTPTPEEVYMKNRTESLCLEPPSSSVCFSSPGSQDSSEYSESSLNAESSQLISTTHIPKTKLPRPFKAYPKDPLSIAIGVVSTETLLGQNSADAYGEFRKKMLSQVQSQHQGTNKNMRRNTQKGISVNEDPSYWEKRRKNNEAAKRSRDARRAKEDEIAIRCAFLEQENLKLRYEVATLRSESERLKNMLYH
ncbi:thyrotroph embryonic factor related [Holotrichia oblita]|uniref:Thyrotroph embryonic factor related n=1 Tax=Holotrichia oblita TaxID=644536 RepID=A0ACB9TBS3_HOLOL|nr:thyrotroph embryonic factor related [Holotrichia oblita]